jgi:hypothetical protein
MNFVMNVTDICRPHVVILALGELDHLFLSYLVKLIYVQSLHALVYSSRHALVINLNLL